jgi:serine/threonine-protein kinase TTK/MPS1
MAIHEHEVVHADVKPANFLLVKGRLKMIDFGLAIDIPKGERSTVRNFVGGTKEYLSPETLSCFVIEEGVIKDPKPSGQQQALE